MANKASADPCIPPEQLPIPKFKTTIIVGAGASGLSTAYNLAKRWQEDQSQDRRGDRIIVIDVLEHTFAAASLYNSGILSYQWFSGDLQELARYSYAWYEDIAEQDENFRETTGYGDHSNFRLCRGSMEFTAQCPEWLNVPKGWHLELDPIDGRAATINPQGLGMWLLRQCQHYGVEIYNQTEILRADTSPSGILERVQLSRRGKVLEISCDNLVLAAGAWTPRLYKKLFPSSDADFCPKTNSGNWLVVKSPAKPLIHNRCEIIFDDYVEHQLEFVGRNDGTIWISGLDNRVKRLGDVKGSEVPDEDAFSMLSGYARRFLLASEMEEGDDPDVLATGRTYRPTIDRELPIIAHVDPRKLCPVNQTDGNCPVGDLDGPPGGVFVCSGHGRYGITLAMGSGRLMSQMIMGDPTDFDVSKLGLPG